MDLIDSKYVDVKIENGVLVASVPLKQIALDQIKPALEKLKAKIPGQIDDALIDFIVKEIEGA